MVVLSYVIADKIGTRNSREQSAEGNDQGHIPSEHVTLTVKTPADDTTHFLELQDVSFCHYMPEEDVLKTMACCLHSYA